MQSEKSYNFSFAAQGLLLFTMCIYIYVGNKKAQNSTSFQTLKQFLGVCRSNDAFAVQLDALFMLSFPGAMGKTGIPLSLVPHVLICWLCGTGWEAIFEVENVEHNVDFIIKTVKVADGWF